jgi:hypothetical protein
MRMSGERSSQRMLEHTTASPGLTPRTSGPTAHTMPAHSDPAMWKSSGSPRFWRIAITSRGVPDAAHTPL